MGLLDVDVVYQEQHARLPVVMVKGSGRTLLERDWLSRIHLDWQSVFNVDEHTLSNVLENHQLLFEPGSGKLSGYTAKIVVDSHVPPKFCKARPVPYALRKHVEEELECLQQQDILEPVIFQWRIQEGVSWGAADPPFRLSDYVMMDC